MWEKSGNSYFIKIGQGMLVVTNDHIRYPGEWVMRHPLLDLQPLNTDNAQGAKITALMRVREKAMQIVTAVDEALV